MDLLWRQVQQTLSEHDSKYSLHPQIFVAFDFCTNFDHSYYSKKVKVMKKSNI
jgi:hypothetical protein